MLFFKKKKIEPLDLSWIGADMHSHLIPGIDDGAPDPETSIQLIKGLAELGYKKLITTPHVLWEIYPNTAETITSGQDELNALIKEAGLDISLHAAAEYFIDEHFDEQLKKKMPLLPISGNMVLVEFSMVTAPLDLQNTLFEMQLQNYQPVIAHPERYAYLSRNKKFYDELKETGCYFQLNLLSLTGYYGDVVKDLAEYLLKRDMYDLAGTDLHHSRHLTSLQKLAASPLYQELKYSNNLKNRML